MGLFNNRFTSALMNKKRMDNSDTMEDPNAIENSYPEQQESPFDKAVNGPDPMAPPKKKTLADKLTDIYAKNKTSQDALQKEASTPLDESLYKPSFGRKLGAALVGAAAGYGNPAVGYAMGSRIASAPLDNAKENRQDRLADLGKAVKVEGDKLGQALDIEKAGYQEEQDIKDNEFRSKDLEIRTNADARAAKAADDAHVSNLLQDKMVEKKLAETNSSLEAGEDGYLYLINKDTGDMQKLGKTGQDAKERLADKKAILAYGSGLDQDREIAVDTARTKNDIELQGKRDAAAKERADAKNKTTLDAIAARYKAQADKDPKFADDVNKLVRAASQAAAAVPGLDVNGLIDMTGAIPKVAEDSIWDDPKTKEIKAALRAQLAGGVATTPGTPNADPLGIRK